MKSFKINLAVVAMLVAVTAAFAFKPVSKAKVTGSEYGFDNSISSGNKWVSLAGLTEDNNTPPADNTYRCDDAPSQICSGFFTTPPTQSSDTPDTGTEVHGAFSLN